MNQATATQHHPIDEASAAPPRRRVLVLRSCRPAQFAAAIGLLRQRGDGAELVALTHRGHGDSLRAAGVDRIIELTGTRFGLLRTAAPSLLRLRAERFDEVVIPQMTADDDTYRNLHRFAAVLGAPEVTIFPGQDAPVTRGAREFRRFAFTLRSLAAFYQRPAFLLALLAAACVWPRRRRSAPDASTGTRRILHVISSLGVGGAQRQLAELVNRTAADRYAVDILVLGRDDGEFSRQWIARPDVRVMYLSKWPRLIDSVAEVRRCCRDGQYDLVHTWLFMANVIGVAGARLAGVPHVIASVRNLSLWKRTWYAQWWFRPADALCSRAADVVTVNADALRDDHARWAWYPAERVAVIHNGLEPSQFLGDVREARMRVRDAVGLPEQTPIIGTVGRLAPEKDHKTFLEIVRQVRDARPDVHAVVVGDGQLRHQLEGAAAGMSLGETVHFLGERHDARRLMAGFDVFVLTSTIEGFPNVLLEAAFLGVPSVSSRVGGAPDVLPHAEDTFGAGAASVAAGRVLELLDDRPRALLRAEETRARALTLFTADRTASRWFALYDRCLSEEAPL